MHELQLGIIGLSPGNGHPYSWSAIFNGYDKMSMESCGFPVIPRYLERQIFPRDAIAGAKVTHVWSQDLSISNHIAQTCNIEHVAIDFNDMVGKVDAILLARDDSENHLKFIKPFLESGIPVYIDKPIALNAVDFEKIYSYESYPGQIFSCSAYRFASELESSRGSISSIGKIGYVIAIVPKDWKKYGVHLVDPILNMLNLYQSSCEVKRIISGNIDVVEVDWGSIKAKLFCMGSVSCEVKIFLFGDIGCLDIVMRDTYSAFKNSLSAFISGIQNKCETTKKQELKTVVSILERGCLT